MSPFRCRVWSGHGRLEENITEETCKEEIESFLSWGQQVPALGRPLTADPDYDVELICGARRLFVARLVNKPLLVELREVSDREAIVAMDIENRQRTDVSPYERGLSYQRWLRAGLFGSQEDLARHLKLSASQVSRLIRLARLPAVIVSAFSSPVEIRDNWGLALMDAVEKGRSRQATIQTAREIAAQSPRPASGEVFRKLLAASANGRKVKAAVHDEVIRGADGSPLFRIRQQRSSIVLVLPMQGLSASSLKEISDAVAGILQRRESTRRVSNLHDCMAQVQQR